ncbi:MAG: hypothetical protein ACRYGI_11495 [Janthinobacterium lividum]
MGVVICSASTCATPITRRATTGMCGKCAAKARWSDPAKCEAHRQGAVRGAKARLERPGERERMQQQILVARAALTPDVYQRANATRDVNVMGWCPPQYRKLNAALRHQNYLLAERKVMIGDLVVSEERRRIAALTPLERQLERVRNGATVSTKVPMGSRVHAMSLTGCSMGSL